MLNKKNIIVQNAFTSQSVHFILSQVFDELTIKYTLFMKYGLVAILVRFRISRESFLNTVMTSAGLFFQPHNSVLPVSKGVKIQATSNSDSHKILKKMLQN